MPDNTEYTADELQKIIDGYVAVLNGHVLAAEDLRGKIQALRDTLRTKLVF